MQCLKQAWWRGGRLPLGRGRRKRGEAACGHEKPGHANMTWKFFVWLTQTATTHTVSWTLFFLSVVDFFLFTRTRGRVYTELEWHKEVSRVQLPSWKSIYTAWFCSVLLTCLILDTWIATTQHCTNHDGNLCIRPRMRNHSLPVHDRLPTF